MGGLAGGRAEGQPCGLEAAQHLHHAGVNIPLMAALDGIARAVALGGLLDLGGVRKMLAKALAEGRANIAVQVAPGNIALKTSSSVLRMPGAESMSVPSTSNRIAS